VTKESFLAFENVELVRLPPAIRFLPGWLFDVLIIGSLIGVYLVLNYYFLFGTSLPGVFFAVGGMCTNILWFCILTGSILGIGKFGRVFHDMLAWKGWSSVARLSYQIYLLHPTVIILCCKHYFEPI